MITRALVRILMKTPEVELFTQIQEEGAVTGLRQTTVSTVQMKYSIPQTLFDIICLVV